MHFEERDFSGTARVPVYVMLPVSLLLSFCCCLARDVSLVDLVVE